MTKMIFQNNFSSYQCNFLLRDQVKTTVKSKVGKIETHWRSATHLHTYKVRVWWRLLVPRDGMC